MINYGRHFIDDKDVSSVVKALKSSKLTQGNLVGKFENQIKNKFKSKYCCVVSSGTASLHLSCIALNLKNSIVLTTPNTFLATANAILYADAKPDFVDINRKTFNIDVIKLEEKIIYYKSKKKKVSAVIATDYAGLPCDWVKLKYLSRKYNFKLINDNCHAIGAKYNGMGYATKYADVVTHSYHPVKNITTGEGGAVLTNNKKIDKRVRILRNHGLEKMKKNSQYNPWPFEMKYLGYNYRITDFQCALGISQLKKLNKFVKRRRQIAQIYKKEIESVKHVNIQENKNINNHAFHIYPISINFKKFKITKNKLIKIFLKNKIKVQTHYFPIHIQPYYKKNYNFKKGDFPEAEKFYGNTISLPIYYSLKNQEVYKVLRILKKNLK